MRLLMKSSRVLLNKILARSVALTCAIALSVAGMANLAVASEHPKLIINKTDVKEMRQAILRKGRFQSAFQQKKAAVDRQLSQVINVPMPKDAGGGYTHERHKKNYSLMYDAGVIYQLTQESSYAEYVKSMLLQYAQNVPNIAIAP